MKRRPLHKRLALAQPHPLLLAEYFGWWGIQELKRRRRGLGRSFAPAPENLADLKTSDTVFILGSGWSINGITEAGWETISECDSFGFNYWIAHPHVPSLYFFEAIDPVQPDEVCADLISRSLPLFAQIVHDRAEDYRGVPKLLTDYTPARAHSLEMLPEAWLEEVSAIRTAPAFARTGAEFKTALKALEAGGVFDRQDLKYVLKYRATIVMLVSLAARMGYRRIVLCGIDMTDPRYFYETDDYPLLAGFRSSPPGPTHPTIEEIPMMANVPECLDAMEHVILKPRGLELFVENRSSALHPRFSELRAHDA